MPPLSLSLSSLFLFIALFFINPTASFSSDASLLSYCNHTFSCGPLRDISYPFTGGQRPEHCGPPEFRLTCLDDDSPHLTIESLSYRVIQLDQTHQSLVLARSDLYNNTCTHRFANTTLNLSFFNFGSNNEDLTLFYGCPTQSTYGPANLFACDLNGTISDAYYLIGPVPTDPLLRGLPCDFVVTVPILESAAEKVLGNRSLLAKGLMEGFSVNYSNPYDDHCKTCRESGGECGFDLELGRPICICGEQICPGKGKSTSLAIGLAIGGAGIFGVLLGCLILFIVRRRKKTEVVSKSKELPTPPSSKGVTTPTTNFSQSTFSYPSSKSDLEKGSTYFGVQVFSYSELEEATDYFNPSKELGDGGFGIVYYGVLNDGRAVAVKRLYEKNIKRVEQFMNEVEILTRLRHPNLVALYGCTTRHSRELLLVYEYIPNGTVADHLHGNRANSGLLTWPVRLSIALETADALAYLHSSDVIHRDVKSNNILLDNNFHVKVADFGLSRLFPNDVTHVSTAPQGTPGYVDPEYYQCYHLTDKSDVYSFGVVLIELISSLEAVDTNRHRHDINLANMAINKVQNHLLHELVDPLLGFEKDYAVRQTITSVAELAFRCLQQERDMRPSMEEVVEILKGIQNDELRAQQAEVVDIRADDVGLLKNMPPPISPDSVMTDKWVSSSGTSNSF